MPDPVLSNYPILIEQSIDFLNVHNVDVGGLKDGPYHPHVAGFNYCHQILAKDQEWSGTSCLDTDMFYPTELKLVYYKYNTPFAGFVHWIDWKVK